MKTQEIKRGEFNAYYLISDLKVAIVNRDLFTKHAYNFKSKLNDFGWMMPIVVSKNGNVIEGHHRIQAAVLLQQKTIPAYIVDWVNTDIESEHLDYIINLNNGNRAWTKLDYLKAFSKEKKDYRIVFDSYSKNINNISIGNIINCYFNKSKQFNKGLSKIDNLDFAEYLINNISFLVSKHTTKKIQAYCVRELIKISYSKTNMDKKAMDYLFKHYDMMATQNHLSLTSISDFKPYMEFILNDYKKIQCK
jgi:hypothetical protein